MKSCKNSNSMYLVISADVKTSNVVIDVCSTINEFKEEYKGTRAVLAVLTLVTCDTIGEVETEVVGKKYPLSDYREALEFAYKIQAKHLGLGQQQGLGSSKG